VARVCTFGSILERPSAPSAWSTLTRGVVAALTGAGLLVAAAGDADAYVVKKTSRGDLVHWEERTIKYTIDPSVDSTVAQATDATVHAMNSWSGSVGAPDLETASIDASSPKTPTFDQKNGIFFMKGGYAPAGRALAITVLTYDNGTGRILDADVIFNGKYSFEVLSTAMMPYVSTSDTHLSNTDGISHSTDVSVDRSRETVYDLHHVIAHELGHSLGMNDELGLKDALMYRYSAPNDPSIREPAPDDIAGLAELYSTSFEARGNGCGSATVAPKKPSSAASRVAAFATLGFLLFLVLRAKSDRRARVGFVLALAASAVALVPSLSGRSGGPGVARANVVQPFTGHARAKVIATSTMIDHGLFKTSYKLTTTSCHETICPNASHGETWGGTIGNVTQEVGGYYAPAGGDEVDVSFASLPAPLTALSRPLAGRIDTAALDIPVSVLTRVQ
jgi:hypothetical protein